MILQTKYNSIREKIGTNYKDLILNTSKYNSLVRKDRIYYDGIVAFHVEPDDYYTQNSGAFYVCKIFLRDRKTRNYVLNTIYLTRSFTFIRQTFKTKINDN